MTVAAVTADPWGYNPIFNGNDMVGMTSSGGYGHRVEQSIALGYVPPELATPGTKLEVEVWGKKLPAQVVAMPLNDSAKERKKGRYFDDDVLAMSADNLPWLLFRKRNQ
mgnify:CR=1 FL=1